MDIPNYEENRMVAMKYITGNKRDLQMEEKMKLMEDIIDETIHQ